MKRAFLFPGQGVDLVPLVDAWVQRGDDVGILARAEDETGCSRRDWLARGGRLLCQTEILQPVMTAVVMIIDWSLEEAGVRPDLVAGHSLGEIAAWASAGGIGRQDAVSVAGARGRLMADLALRNPGGMLALTDIDQDSVDAILVAFPEVDPAAQNAPGEWVLSGKHTDLETIRSQWGGQMLEVAGPWHAKTMAPGIGPFRRTLTAAGVGSLSASLVTNRQGLAVVDPGDIPELLAGQLAHPIQWVATMKTLEASGVNEYLVPGPGKVLRGLARQCLGKGPEIRLIATPEDLVRLVEDTTCRRKEPQ